MTAEPTLRDFLNNEVEIARKLFAEFGVVHLMFIGQDATGQRHVIQAITHNDDDKDAAADMVRRFFAANGIVRYAATSEAWALLLDKDADATGVRPSAHPDRIEVVMIQAYDQGPNSLSAMMKIVRKVNTKARLADAEVNEGPSLGRFANLLETKQ